MDVVFSGSKDSRQKRIGKNTSSDKPAGNGVEPFLQLDKGVVVKDVAIIGDRDLQQRQALLERNQIHFSAIYLGSGSRMDD